LMKDADIALYRAKAQGRNRVVTYSSKLRMATEERVTLGRDVREAISKDQIVPFYQPKVCLTSGRIIGLEALARWQHPTKGVLTPGFFGAVFDDPELAQAISDSLISQVASDMREWLDQGFDLGRVAVNLSSAQFGQSGLADEILGILERSNVPPEHFEIEVTETVFLGKSSDYVAAILGQFRQRGVQIALDDFGTGYASLTHLKQFPVDHLKVDQSFVRNLEHDTGDEAIVTAVIGLGRSLNLQVTAEGVETLGQAKRLRELGCHNAQGYLYARPMAASQVPDIVSSWVDRAMSERRISLVRNINTP
jgi:EAL domain-containing protein (putative c-di-GMP-specific phosphodiesterase class I)